MFKANYHVVESYVRGTDVAKQFGVRGAPTLIFLDSKGEPICRAFGGFNHPDDAVSLHKYVQKAVADPATRAAQNTRNACGRIE